MRATLVDGLKDAFEKNSRNKDQLGLNEVRLFEIGTVWKKEEEKIMIGTADEKGVREDSLDEKGNVRWIRRFSALSGAALPNFFQISGYRPRYCDVGPRNTKPEDVLEVIRANAGELLRTQCTL